MLVAEYGVKGKLTSTHSPSSKNRNNWRVWVRKLYTWMPLQSTRHGGRSAGSAILDKMKETTWLYDVPARFNGEMGREEDVFDVLMRQYRSFHRPSRTGRRATPTGRGWSGSSLR